jgi:glycosyltransferase involved in cell wall biosynthesis
MYAQLLEDQHVAHLHAHFSLNACTLAMLISAWSDIDFSFTVHAHDIFIHDLADLMEHKLQTAKFVAAISEFNKRHLLERYPSIDEDKIKIVHCGLDLRQFVPASPPANRRTRILAVGRLHEQKGFEYLVRACGMLKSERGLDFECVIIGDGEERTPLERLIQKMEVDDVVHLAGAVDQHHVASALKAADIFVLPCVAAKNGAMDGIPVALMEAMAMGVPVISTRISGIPELIGSDAGMIVESGDFRGLSDAIFRFASLSRDERREFGRHGRATIEARYNLDTEASKLAALFGDGAATVSGPSLAI